MRVPPRLARQGAAPSSAPPRSQARSQIAPLEVLHRTLDRIQRMVGSERILNGLDAIAAIAWNNRRWTGELRRELLQFLRGTPVAEDQSYFVREDIDRITAIQEKGGLARDGKVGDATMAVVLHMPTPLGLTPMGEAQKPFRFSDEVVGQQGLTLIFAPGEMEDLAAWEAVHAKYASDYSALIDADKVPVGAGRIYVRAHGHFVAQYEARGGPPVTFKDGTHTADPTGPGTYRLGAPEAHTTRSWGNSQIPWGTPMFLGSDGEFYARTSKGVLKATGPGSLGIDRAQFFTKDGTIDPQAVPVWKLNDFGPRAWNLKSAGKGTALYMHTTPGDEKYGTIRLSPSHGCIHLHPADRDEMVARGFLVPGARLVVLGYQKHFLSDEVRHRTLDAARKKKP